MFYNHALIKESAKTCFNDNNGSAIGVVAVGMAMASVYRIFLQVIETVSGVEEQGPGGELFLIYIILILLVFSLFFLVWSVYEVGTCFWSLKAVKGERPRFKEVFRSFSFYPSSIKVAFLRNLYIFLWYLVFIIPGIIKYYSYFGAYYIVSENPDIPTSKALDLSKRMMEGHKMDVFYLQISFIGWFMLSIFTCGILALVYVSPWYNCAMAQAYNVIKLEAIEMGKVYEEELMETAGKFY